MSSDFSFGMLLFFAFEAITFPVLNFICSGNKASKAFISLNVKRGISILNGSSSSVQNLNHQSSLY